MCLGRPPSMGLVKMALVGTCGMDAHMHMHMHCLPSITSMASFTCRYLAQRVSTTCNNGETKIAAGITDLATGIRVP